MNASDRTEIRLPDVAQLDRDRAKVALADYVDAYGLNSDAPGHKRTAMNLVMQIHDED